MESGPAESKIPPERHIDFVLKNSTLISRGGNERKFLACQAFKKTDKSLGKLPKLVLNALALLLQDIELTGPVRGDWPNYSKLGPKIHHCHLKKGRPTYVAVWIETDTGYEVEVIYAGTHEKAPY